MTAHGLAWFAGLALTICGLSACNQTPPPAPTQPQPAGDISLIGHMVFMVKENRTFDNLFGTFPGASGLAQGRAQAAQVDRDGRQPDDVGEHDRAAVHQIWAAVSDL